MAMGKAKQVQFVKLESLELSFRGKPMPGSETHLVQDGDGDALYAIVPAGLKGKDLWNFVLKRASAPLKKEMRAMHDEAEAGECDHAWKEW